MDIKSLVKGRVYEVGLEEYIYLCKSGDEYMFLEPRKNCVWYFKDYEAELMTPSNKDLITIVRGLIQSLDVINMFLLKDAEITTGVNMLNHALNLEPYIKVNK